MRTDESTWCAVPPGTAVLAERDRIGRELDDRVTRPLFTIGLGLHGLAARVPSGQVGQRLRQVVEQLDEVIREVRETVFDLREVEGDSGPGLRARLLAALAIRTADSRVASTVSLPGDLDRLVPPWAAAGAEAVVVAAVGDVLRHARATEVAVQVRAGAELRIDVTDNGCGLPADEARAGLRELACRATNHAGALEVGPEPGGGTRLTWRLPLPGAQAAPDESPL
ncbi:sensor histidine kinase [Amycolatopsis aidingensis]|uniref:sensor histidine kinase n=1 Tax=Amycolatopsis aidingensis TaxID=2842453 RepID=UPI001C0D50C6|nr:histidine kinase [Amycolatopsis aidingensis]